MIDALVFSKDRPAQLDLLLHSISVHADDLYSSVCVLWTTTHERYFAGYSLVDDLHRDELPLSWVRERDFDTDVRRWFRGAGAVVSFLVDDDVFYADAQAPTSLPFSYRGGDYDYPFSVDGNVYARADLLLMFDLLPPFRNPSELEAFGHQLRHRLPFSMVTPAAPAALVGIPANRVSANSGVPHMGVDPWWLNDRFLDGERLQIPRLRAPVGAHAELELELA